LSELLRKPRIANTRKRKTGKIGARKVGKSSRNFAFERKIGVAYFLPLSCAVMVHWVLTAE
jgi:hypothetical protein